MRKLMGLICVVLLGVALLAPSVPAQQPAVPVTGAIAFQSAATAAGNGNVFNVGNMAVLGIQVVMTSSSTATVTMEGSVGPSSTWNAISCYPQGSSTASAAPAIGIFRCNVLGVNRVRARLSSVVGSGGISVYGYGTSLGPLPVDVP